jgi:integrase
MKLLKQAGLPNIRFHDLRHSAASLLLSLGIHPKVVQELLGRTQISITMDVYSHLLPGRQKDAMSKLDEALKKKPGDEKKESS